MYKEKRTIGDATIYRGDSLLLLGQLDEQFDALITDPPYSSGGRTKGQRIQLPSKKYATSKAAAHNIDFAGDTMDARSWRFWTMQWLTSARESIKLGGYALVFTDWRQLPALTDAMQMAGWTWRGIIAWDKGLGARAPHKGYFRHQCEYIVWGSNGSLPKATHGGPWPGCINQRVDPREKLHMTGKPVALMEQLVQVIQPGGHILDPFMGSASTAVAALNRDYKFTGIECTQHYFDISAQRLEGQQRCT